MNLSFETREGILKHCSRRNAERLLAAEPGGVGRRFLERTQPSLEAQLCNLADEIAYNAHDIDDGVRSGLLTLQQLREVSLFAGLESATLAQFPGLTGRRLLFEVIRRMLSQQIYDVIDRTTTMLADAKPRSADEVRRLPPLVAFSDPMRRLALVLKRFLHHNLYRHPQVLDTTGRGKQVIRELFAAYLADPAELPESLAMHGASPRRVADYIAGMTDRFALREHHRLTGRTLFGPVP